jgi:peptidoglycan/LPS O-acetylase OafA/YrhL
MMHRYRRDIDGLRAVAILPVVLFHARIPGFSGGYVGVDVFFVISGFLIAGIIAEEIGRDSFSVAGFYERRARRILPALFTVIAVSFALAALIALPEAFAEFARSAVATTLFASNLYFWQATDYFSSAAEYRPLLHTWSLAVEEQFYIFFPWFLVLLLRWRRTWLPAAVALCAVASLAASILGTRLAPTAAFYLLPTRGWELLLGVALALNLVPPLGSQRLREAAAFAGMAMIVAAVALFDAQTPFPGAAALLPCLGTALLIHAGSGAETLVGRLLSLRWMVFVGLISYSLYLWHWPVLAFLRQGYGSVALPPAVALAAVAASVLLAVLSWRFVERPFRQRGRIGRAQIFRLAAGGSVAVLALGLVVSALQGLPWRIDATTQALAATAQDREEIRQACMDRLPDDRLCVVGRPGATPSVLLWGDSHAGALMPALEVALDAAGLSGYVASHSACAPLLGVRRADAYNADHCVRFNDALLRMVEARAGEIHTVVLAGRWPLNVSGERAPGEDGAPAVLASLEPAGSDPAGNAAIFRRGLAAMVARLKASGLRVVILGGVPEIGWDVPALLASRLRLGLPLPPVPMLDEVKARHADADAILAAVAREEGAEVVPLVPLLCRPACDVRERDLLLYADDDHLSIRGGREVLGPRLVGRIWPAAGNLEAGRL